MDQDSVSTGLSCRVFGMLLKEFQRENADDQRLMEDAMAAGMLDLALQCIQRMNANELSHSGSYPAKAVLALNAMSGGGAYAIGGATILLDALDKLLRKKPEEGREIDHVETLAHYLSALVWRKQTISWDTLIKHGATDQFQPLALKLVERLCVAARFVLIVLCEPEHNQDRDSHLRSFGRNLRHMLTEFCDSHITSEQLVERLRIVVKWMHGSTVYVALVRWLIRYGLVPLARFEMQSRRNTPVGHYCARACCAARGPGAATTLTVLLQVSGALRRVATVISTHASVRALGARLVAYLVQENAGNRVTLMASPEGVELLRALQAARCSTILLDEFVAGCDRGAADDAGFDTDDGITCNGAPGCTRTPADDCCSEPLATVEAAIGALTGEPVSLAAREAAAERAAASLLAEEEADKASKSGTGASGPGKKSKKKSKPKSTASKAAAAQPAPAASAAAEPPAVDDVGSESDDAVDEAAMAAALARSRQGAAKSAAKMPARQAGAPATAREPEQGVAAAASSLASLSLRPSASPPADEPHEDDTLCLICLDAPRDTPLPGCETAHAAVLCAPCVVRLLTGPTGAATCPLCRAPAFP